MSKRQQGESPAKRKTERLVDKKWPEVMMLGQACKYLGVSHAKITKLVHGGVLKYSHSELDHRVKLVKKSDLDALKRLIEPK